MLTCLGTSKAVFWSWPFWKSGYLGAAQVEVVFSAVLTSHESNPPLFQDIVSCKCSYFLGAQGIVEASLIAVLVNKLKSEVDEIKVSLIELYGFAPYFH